VVLKFEILYILWARGHCCASWYDRLLWLHHSVVMCFRSMFENHLTAAKYVSMAQLSRVNLWSLNQRSSL